MAKPIRAFQQNTFPKLFSKKAFFLPSLALGLLLAGCGPEFTYPTSKIPESIERICRDEYKLEVNARVVGHTMGALLYTDSILDETGQVPKEVHEQMGKVMMVVTRVGLSTDLPAEFCVVVIRDKKTPMELVITRSLDDTKRANADAIGIEESINRTLFGQAKIEPGPDGMDAFVLKEVHLENFLSEQIIQRTRFGLAKEIRAKKDKIAKKVSESDAEEERSERPAILVDGDFQDKDGRRIFNFSVLSLKREDPRETTLSVFKIANQVFEGYHFENFDAIEIRDYLNRQKLVVDKQTLLDYQKKIITEEEILENYLVESKAAQEAFKLFGFNASSLEGQEEAPFTDEENLSGV